MNRCKRCNDELTISITATCQSCGEIYCDSCADDINNQCPCTTTIMHNCK
jgi:hypothetical protein